MKKLILFIFIGILLVLPLVIADEQDHDYTFKLNQQVDLKRPCWNNGTYCTAAATCNLTVLYPNSTILISNEDMTNSVSYFNKTLTPTVTGLYFCIMTCEDAAEHGSETFYFDVTLSGVDPGASNPMVSLGIIALIFGIACFFLFISSQLNDAGPKIFFLLASFVFMIGSLAVSYVIAFESNLASQINSTVTTMLYAFGLIFFVIFAYIMIKQIVASVDLYRQNKGYEMDY